MIDEKRLYVTLGERIRRFREDQALRGGRMTQAELAEAVGLERTSITNIERGNQKVPLHVLFRICEVLRAPITEMLPALPEVQSAEVTESIDFEGRTYQASPLVAQALANILKTGDFK